MKSDTDYGHKPRTCPPVVNFLLGPCAHLVDPNGRRLSNFPCSDRLSKINGFSMVRIYCTIYICVVERGAHRVAIKNEGHEQKRNKKRRK